VIASTFFNEIVLLALLPYPIAAAAVVVVAIVVVLASSSSSSSGTITRKLWQQCLRVKKTRP